MRTKKTLKVRRGLSGLGLFTTRRIPKGTIVLEYAGRLLTDAAAEKKGGLYLFQIPDQPWTIDGSSRSNLARYVNHSCKPNCETFADDKRVYIEAIRNIEPGEELTYDYGRQYMGDDIKAGKCKCGHHRRRR